MLQSTLYTLHLHYPTTKNPTPTKNKEKKMARKRAIPTEEEPMTDEMNEIKRTFSSEFCLKT